MFRKRLLILALTLGLTAPTFADDMREFIMACTYGVLAGTLVGAATLAFTNKPGENLRNVARGASIGLYTGIILGAYVVYGVSGSEKSQEEKDGLLGLTPASVPRFALVPVINEESKVTGAVSQFQIFNF